MLQKRIFYVWLCEGCQGRKRVETKAVRYESPVRCWCAIEASHMGPRCPVSGKVPLTTGPCVDVTVVFLQSRWLVSGRSVCCGFASSHRSMRAAAADQESTSLALGSLFVELGVGLSASVLKEVDNAAGRSASVGMRSWTYACTSVPSWAQVTCVGGPNRKLRAAGLRGGSAGAGASSITRGRLPDIGRAVVRD